MDRIGLSDGRPNIWKSFSFGHCQLQSRQRRPFSILDAYGIGLPQHLGCGISAPLERQRPQRSWRLITMPHGDDENGNVWKSMHSGERDSKLIEQWSFFAKLYKNTIIKFIMALWGN